jgi:sugar lactone lactonase YvrE
MHQARRALPALTAVFALALLVTAGSAQAFTFVNTFGSLGSGNGQLSTPDQIAVDPAGNVYVADGDNRRIEEFSASGAFIRQIGSGGGGDGQFDGVYGVAADPTGNFIYATDGDFNQEPGTHDRVNEYTTGGTFVRSFGTTGTADGDLKGPAQLTVAPNGNVYVSDEGNNRIEEFTATGTFIRQWGTAGTGDGQFNGPDGIVADAAGHVYVTEDQNGRVQEFTSTGTFIGKFGEGAPGDGHFQGPFAIAEDAASHLWVTDITRVQEFTSTGEFLGAFAGGGDNGAHLFSELNGIAVTCRGVYTADFQANRVELFSDGDVPACPSPPAPPVTTPGTPTPPRLSLALVSLASQRVLRQHGVAVNLSADEASTVTVTGSVSVPGASRTVKFKKATVKLPAGAQRVLKLRLSRKALGQLKRALRSHHSLKAKLTVTAKDASAKSVTYHRVIKLTR